MSEWTKVDESYIVTLCLLTILLFTGIWGSAFCILFKRLLEDNRKLDPVEMIRLEMGKFFKRNLVLQAI